MEVKSFIEAVKNGERKKISEWHEIVTEMLINYLRIHFRATKQDAEDCVQDALVMLLDDLQNGKELPDNPGGYIRTIVRNNYFRIHKETTTKVGDEVLEFEEASDSPAAFFEDSELKKLLRVCIKLLDDVHQKFINMWINRPGIRADEMAKRFDISVSNAWVRRHRIQKQLEECVRKKM